MKIIIDPKKCINCGACESLAEGAIIAPEDKPAIPHPQAKLNDPQVQEAVKLAAEVCPTQAIKLK